MTAALAKRIGLLTDMGWSVRSQTESTAALETRRPFNWMIFLLLLIFSLGGGALLYTGYWLLTSRAQIFPAVEEEGIAVHGDTWLVQNQERDIARAIEAAEAIRQRGFWSVMWPSVVGSFVFVGVWFLLIWGFIALVR